MIRNKHWSPFEHGFMTVQIKTSRAIGAQLLRHRSFTFQELCIAGSSLITCATSSGRTYRIPIEKLYERYKSDQYWNMSDNLVKVYDEESKTFTFAKIKEVFNTGQKPVLKMTLETGKQIISTKDHKFLTRNGFSKLEDLKVGDLIGCNGIPVYQDASWLKEKKEESLTKGGLAYISETYGINYNTLRKWLKHYNLQFTKKEVAQYTQAWNKGLESSLQPGFNRVVSEETRNKMRDSSRKGELSNLYSTGGNDTRKWRIRIADFCKRYHKELLITQNYICPISGESIDLKNSQVDHKLPVFSNPELAFDKSNLQVISKAAHLEKTRVENATAKSTVSWVPIKKIETLGIENTYDIEVEHISHNYIANSIVTHNSQRYANLSEVLKDDNFFQEVELRKAGSTNRQSSIEEEGFNPLLPMQEPSWRFSSLSELNLTDGTRSNVQEFPETINILDENKEVEYKMSPDGNFISAKKAISKHLESSLQLYNQLVSAGVATEVARMVLPLNTTTHIYMTGSIRSWIHFLDLRDDSHAQKEVRIIAQMIKNIFIEQFPIISNALEYKVTNFENQ